MYFSRHFVGLAFAAVAASSVAGPAEIDLVGLKMGESELSDIQKIGTRVYPTSEVMWRLEIGGHPMPCYVKFLEGKLSGVNCRTGEGSGRERNTQASNKEVHEDLKAGYRKKFGKPDTDDVEEVQTRMGAKFLLNRVTWSDKAGNLLSISNMYSSIDTGSLIFLSQAERKRMAEDREKSEATKKF